MPLSKCVIFGTGNYKGYSYYTIKTGNHYKVNGFMRLLQKKKKNCIEHNLQKVVPQQE